MASLFPDFRHSVYDDPTDNWTIEELMQWILLQSHQATDDKHDELVSALDRQMEEGEAEIWKCHEKAVKSSLMQDEDDDANNDVENANPQSSAAAASSTSPNKRNNKKTRVKYIRVSIIAGPYQGETFKLEPKPRGPCWVGRSAGKKFRDRGISLARDEEVSTTHGKFEILSGKAYFTDTGSTNGTHHEEQELETNAPMELSDGMVLRMGATEVKMQLELV